MSKTIGQFNPARIPYTPDDLIGIGIGTPPYDGTTIVPTYRGSLRDLVSFLQIQLGVGQATFVGNTDYVMGVNDFELATSVTFSSSRTWTLCNANQAVRGQRRRIVDLAGVVGAFNLVVNPAGSNTINGSNSPVVLSVRYASLILESDGASGWTVVTRTPTLVASNNLSDLQNIVTARTNLGLGSSATQPSSAFMVAANNLSEISSTASTARGNLGLGGLAVLNNIVYANLDPSMIATAADIAAATPGKLVPSNVSIGSQTPITIPFAGTNGNNPWDFGTFVNGIWTIPPSSTSPITVATPVNVKPGQQGFIIIKGTAGIRTVNWPAALNQVSTAVSSSIGVNTNNLLEYWAESSSMVRTRVTLNIG